MTNVETITAYQQSIEALDGLVVGATDARILLDSWERKLKLYEAELLLSGAAEGKNAEERAARLLMASTESADCQSIRASIEQTRRDVAEADALLSTAREQARFYRLVLALATAPGVQEFTA